jgi:hypothetical protein
VKKSLYVVDPFFACRNLAVVGVGSMRYFAALTATVPFALPMSDPLILTLAAGLADTKPLAELVAVMSPVETIVPVLALLSPVAVVPLPPVSVVEVALMVPVLALLMPKAVVPLPPVTVVEVTMIVPELAFRIPGLLEPLIVDEVIVIVPVARFAIALLFVDAPPPAASVDVSTEIDPLEEFKIATALFETPAVTEDDEIVIDPLLLLLHPYDRSTLPPLIFAFVNAIVPAADDDSIAIVPVATVVPATLPAMATMPFSVNVPLEENAIARVDSVKAEPIAWHEASVELAAADTVKQFAEPA